MNGLHLDTCGPFLCELITYLYNMLDNIGKVPPPDKTASRTILGIVITSLLIIGIICSFVN